MHICGNKYFQMKTICFCFVFLAALQCLTCWNGVQSGSIAVMWFVCGLNLWSRDDGLQTHSCECTLKAFIRNAVGPVTGRRAPITFSFVGVTTPLQENSQQTESLKWSSDSVSFHYLFYSYDGQMFHSLVFRPWSEGKRSWGTAYSLSVLSDRRPNAETFTQRQSILLYTLLFVLFLRKISLDFLSTQIPSVYLFIIVAWENVKSDLHPASGCDVSVEWLFLWIKS